MDDLSHYSEILRSNIVRLDELKEIYEKICGDKSFKGRKEKIIIVSEMEEVKNTINNVERYLNIAEWNRRLKDTLFSE